MTSTSRGLSATHMEAIEAREISAETAIRFGLFTGRRGDDGEVVPDLRGNVLVFPYFENGVVVNEKYRAPSKVFWQRKGGRKTFYNADVLDDPSLRDGTHSLVIVEGEPDCLSVAQCATPFVVSVPDGAPPVPKDKKPDDLEPRGNESDDSTGKFEFVWNNRDRLKAIKRYIIGTDNDPPGKRLEAELVRRLNPAKCMFVEWPPEKLVPLLDDKNNPTGERRACKDFNEVHKYISSEAVALMIARARPYPVRGLYELGEFPELPPIEVAKTGWKTLDKKLKPFLGELMFVLGMPGHGKSAFVANLVANLYDQYAWKTAIYSPEEPIVPHLRDKFRRIRARRPLMALETEAIVACDEWIADSFKFIASDPTGEDEEDCSMEWLIERATEAVLRHGIKILVVDPWNELEHTHRRGESQTEYTGRALRMLNRFRRSYGVMVIVLIHPTKEVGKEGKGRMPTPYDADGSAHFFNKADHFVIVFRPEEANTESVIRVAKVKFEGTGDKGSVRLKFDRDSSRYDTLTKEENEDDEEERQG